MSMKKQVLSDLIKNMKKDKGKRVGKSPMKVSVMGDSPEAIKEGLEVAEEVMKGEGPMGEVMDKASDFMKARMKKKKK